MEFKGTIIDSHAHLGVQDRSFDQSFESYLSYVRHTPVEGVVAFPPVMEIYDRYDPVFRDTDQWKERRKRANDYVLNIGSSELFVIPYFFIWNDFKVSQLTFRHKGIKWHRHFNEPEYDYDSALCRKALTEIKKRNMPVVFEEEFKNTVMFLETLALGIKVIIPHLGGLNGGYQTIAEQGLWEKSNVYTDTALASPSEIYDYIGNFGYDRVMFGSDFPFGNPESELMKIQRMNIDAEIKSAVLGGNLIQLLSESNPAA